MAIHHDKPAYGKLAKTSEELTEEKLLEMLKKLKQEEEESEPLKSTENKDKK